MRTGLLIAFAHGTELHVAAMRQRHAFRGRPLPALAREPMRGIAVYNHSMETDVRPSCPRCKGSVQRIHRHLLDRLKSLVRPVHRFECCDVECGWEGTLPAPRAKSDDAITKIRIRL